MAETVRRRQRQGDLEAHQQRPVPPLTPGRRRRRRPVVDDSDLRRAAVEEQPRRLAHQAPALRSESSQHMLLHRDSVACKLQLAQSNEDREKIERELLDTTTPEESSITNASSLPQPTSPLKEELIPTPQQARANFDRCLLRHVPFKEELIPTPWMLPSQASFDQWRQQASGSGYAYHYLAMHEPDMLSSKELSIARATLGKSSDSSSTFAEAVTHSLTPPISARKPAGWNHQFFIRVDLWGVFHTYPELGGPFWSLEEAEKAILRRLDELRDPKMCTNDGLSSSEIAIRDALHWPDGTRKYSSRSNPDRDHVGLLVQALLDKYNEENNLLEDVAYHMEDVVSFQEVYEGDGVWYYHLNCTRKTKVADAKLFFVEVLKRISGQLDEFVLTCLYMVKPVDNGPCYGCTSNDVSMKHPIDAGKYKGGHDPSWPRGSGCDPPSGLPRGFDARMKAKEERIRYLFQDRDVAKSDAGRNIVVDGSDKSLQGWTRTGTVAADGSGKSLQGWTRMATGSAAGSGKSLHGREKMVTGSADGSDKSLQGRTGKYVVPARRW